MAEEERAERQYEMEYMEWRVIAESPTENIEF